MVAHGDRLGAVFPDGTLARFRLGRVHLPYHVADRSSVRMARFGRGRGPVRSPRAGAGLPVHETVSGVGSLRARGGAHPGNLGNLRRAACRGPLGNAVGSRAGRKGRAGSASVGDPVAPQSWQQQRPSSGPEDILRSTLFFGKGTISAGRRTSACTRAAQRVILVPLVLAARPGDAWR